MVRLFTMRRCGSLLRRPQSSRQISSGARRAQGKGSDSHGGSSDEWMNRLDKMEKAYNKYTADMSKRSQGGEGDFMNSMYGFAAGAAIGYIGHWTMSSPDKTSFGPEFQGTMQEVKARLSSIQHAVDQLKSAPPSVRDK
ncbi:hypothetical protein Ae201684P_006622 [Aphanomyces euteiches]|nr:hypothetical protein Ae201684P_006622 [Aphanomyces euteiches]